MFIEADVILEQASSVTIIPADALTSRGDQTGIFLLSQDGTTAVWKEVAVGLRDGDRCRSRARG